MRCRFMKCTEKKEDAETVITVKKARGNSEGIIRRVLAEKGESGKLLIICRTRLIIAS